MSTHQFRFSHNTVLCFFRTDLTITKYFLKWLNKNKTSFFKKYISSKLSYRFEEAILNLHPLQRGPSNKFLFTTTKNSQWVAYFDNFFLGTDTSVVMQYMTHLIGCEGAVFKYKPDSQNQMGITSFQYYQPKELNETRKVRVVELSNNGYNWEFTNYGEPLSFEKTENYNKNIMERFSFELLESYAKKLKLEPFTKDFFLPDQDQGIFIEQKNIFSF